MYVLNVVTLYKSSLYLLTNLHNCAVLSDPSLLAQKHFERLAQILRNVYLNTRLTTWASPTNWANPTTWDNMMNWFDLWDSAYLLCLLLGLSNKASQSNWPKVTSLKSNMTYTYLSRMSFDLEELQFLKFRTVNKDF